MKLIISCLKFLNMINKLAGFCKIAFSAFALLLLTPGTVKAQNELNVIQKWKHYQDAPNSLYSHLSGQAFDLLEKRAKEVNGFNSLADWQQHQESVKEKLMDVLGPFPAKTNLNARVLKTIKKDDYTVEHIVFESQPKFYVTSSLFIPKKTSKKEKLPAIIYCSGHTPQGYRSNTYQQVILNLVKKGFVVFAFDPVGQGERMEYFDEKADKSVVGPPTREHNYPGAQAFISGNSLAKYMIWDGIRAVDYLLTRKEVDTERIGITGGSGGGTQSAYIAALDNRIYAAAPERYITNYTRLLQTIGPQDAEQIFTGGISQGLDHPDLLQVRAPKPLLMVTTTNDFFSIQGARETAQEVSRIYAAYGKPENFNKVEDVAGHSSTKKNREAIYAFFQEHLNKPGSAVDEDVALLSEEESKVTASGQLSTSLGGETVFSLNRKMTDQHLNRLQASRKNSSTHLAAALTSAKKLSGYQEPDAKEKPVFAGNLEKDGYRIEKYLVKGEGDYVIPYLLMIPEKKNNRALLYLHPQGKSAEASKDGEIEWFVKYGFTVLAPDIIGIGEVGPGTLKRGNYFSHTENKGLSYEAWYASLLIGRSIVGIRAADVVRLTKILKNQSEITNIYALAKGEMAPVLLHAAAFEPDIAKVALIEPFSSFRTVVTSRFYDPAFIESAVPGSLKEYDLPDLAAGVAPRKLLMVNVKDGSGKIADPDSLKEDLSVIQKGYALRNATNQLKIVHNPTLESARHLLLDWLQVE